MKKRLLLALVSSLLVLPASGSAQDLVFEGTDFASWSHPKGLVNVLPEGIQVKRFGKTFNAVANTGEFSSSVIGNYGLRFTRTPSNQPQADLVGDQNPATWWQPDPDDPVQQWWLELDLGRSVVANKLRVIFPDTEGARPFNFFSVYVSPGIPVFGGKTKRIVYQRLGRPINNNTSRVVEFDLNTTGIASATGENFVTGETLDFDIVRFIRFEAAGITPDAALAEIEVDGIGFNLASKVQTEDRLAKGLPHWGGRTWTSKDRDCDGCGKPVEVGSIAYWGNWKLYHPGCEAATPVELPPICPECHKDILESDHAKWVTQEGGSRLFHSGCNLPETPCSYPQDAPKVEGTQR